MREYIDKKDLLDIIQRKQMKALEIENNLLKDLFTKHETNEKSEINRKITIARSCYLLLERLTDNIEEFQY